MYWKLEPSGCCEWDGVVQLRFDCFLEEGEKGYEDFLVPDPESKTGVMMNTPFVSHFRRFQHEVTDIEIIENGDEIVKMSYDNFQRNALYQNHNRGKEPIRNRLNASKSLTRVNQVIVTDFKDVAFRRGMNSRVR
jgi:hypothetical protein